MSLWSWACGHIVDIIIFVLSVIVLGQCFIIFTTWVHELGHLWMGRMVGLTGGEICVTRGGGGYCAFEETPENKAILARPGARALYAIGGCCMNLVVGLFFFILAKWLLDSYPFSLRSPLSTAAFCMLVFGGMNLLTSAGCLISKEGPEQDYIALREALKDLKKQKR